MTTDEVVQIGGVGGQSPIPGRKVFVTVGNQFGGALESVQVAAKLNDGTLDRIVLVHGGDGSSEPAEQVRDWALGRGIAEKSSIRLLKVNPYSAEIIGSADDIVLDTIIACGGAGIGDWHLLFGSGTQPMNVALAGAWFVEGRRDNLWYWNSRERTLSSYAHQHRGEVLEFEMQVLQRGYAIRGEEAVVPDVDGTCDRCAKTRQWMYGAAIPLRDQLSMKPGDLWEHAVGHLLASVVGTPVSLNVKIVDRKEMESYGRDGDWMSMDREIDVVVKAGGRTTADNGGTRPSVHTVVSCKQSRSKDRFSSLARGAAEEIRRFAERFLGTEAQSLLVMLYVPRDWNLADADSDAGRRILYKGKTLAQLNDKAAKRIRRNERTATRPSRKHWILHGVELFGSSPESFDAVRRVKWSDVGNCKNWAALDAEHQKTLLNLRNWLFGPAGKA